jgi:hypothetical protein
MEPSTKKCACPVCKYGKLIRDLISRQQSQDDKKLLDDLYIRLCHAEEDAEYWRLRARGEWPTCKKA